VVLQKEGAGNGIEPKLSCGAEKGIVPFTPPIAKSQLLPFILTFR